VSFLDDEPSQHGTYLSFARKVLSNPMHLDALNRDFMKDSFNPSKLSIKTKIRNLLNDDYFFNFLVGKSTFDLQTELDNKAVILFDLSDLTEKSKDAIGRFIMANITSIAKARASLPYSKRTPVHLFVDECQNFVSDSMKTILVETRKFRLHGTFAQQFTGQGMNAEMTEAIIGNSAVKITGNNGLKSLKTMSAEIGIPTDELQTLEAGTFYIKSGKKAPAVRVAMPMLTAKDRMNVEEWATVEADQKRLYYRPINTVKNTKPQHARSEPNAGAGTHNNKRKPTSLKETPSGITPHLKPRGQNLDDDPFKKK
jgi:hypothetical protein